MGKGGRRSHPWVQICPSWLTLGCFFISLPCPYSPGKQLSTSPVSPGCFQGWWLCVGSAQVYLAQHGSEQQPLQSECLQEGPLTLDFCLIVPPRMSAAAGSSWTPTPTPTPRRPSSSSPTFLVLSRLQNEGNFSENPSILFPETWVPARPGVCSVWAPYPHSASLGHVAFVSRARSTPQRGPRGSCR